MATKKKKNARKQWAALLALLLVGTAVLLLVHLGKNKPAGNTEISPAPTIPASIGSSISETPKGEETGKKDVEDGTSLTGLPGKEEQKEPSTIPAPTQPAQENNKEDNTKEENQDENPDKNQEENKENDKELEASSVPEQTDPSVEASNEPPALTIQEADAILAEAIQEDGYSFLLSDDHLRTDERTYYCYVILYKEHEENYAVLVDQQNGELFYYDRNGVKTKFEGVMQYQNADSSEEMTAEKAGLLLSDIKASELLLPAELSECSLSLDEWKTMVSGAECYCLNVFYNGALAGNIYFTETADRVYCLNEFGEFVRIR